jgi:hypothetical protein
MTPVRLLGVAVAIVAALTAALAFAATNIVPATRAGDEQVGSIGPNELQPAECRSALGSTLTSIVTNASNVKLNNALFLGTSGNDTVKLKAGSAGNCLVGGAGTDTVTIPNGGTEVCIFDAASQKKPSNLGGCTTTVTRP